MPITDPIFFMSHVVSSCRRVVASTISAAATLFILSASANALPPLTTLPGVWAELETGGWHTASRDTGSASGGKQVSWFDQKGRAVYVDLDISEAMPKALVFVRYSRAAAKPGVLSASIAELPANNQPKASRELPHLTLSPTGDQNKHAWASVPVTDLKAGRYRLVLGCPANGDGGDLDIAGIVPDIYNGLYAPPQRVANGKLDGPGSVAVALLKSTGPAPGNLVTASDKPAPVTLQMWNHHPSETAKITIAGTLTPAKGTPSVIPAVTKELAAGATENIVFDCPLPVPGEYKLALQIKAHAGIDVEMPVEMTLRVVPFAPIWIEAERCKVIGQHVSPQPSGGASGNATLFYGYEPKAGIIVYTDFELPIDMPQTLLYFRYMRPSYRDWAGAAPTEVFLGPPEAAKLDAPGVRKIADTLMHLTKDAMAWQTVSLGALPKGKHRLFLHSPKAWGGGNLDLLGILPPIDRGLWLPPNNIIDGKLAGPDSVRPSAVEVVGSITAPHLGNLLPASYLAPNAKPANFQVTLLNRVVTEAVPCSIVGELNNDRNSSQPLPPKQLTLEPGSTTVVELPVTPPDFGWYSLRVTADAAGKSQPLETSFCVIRPAVKGTRPDSMFGLAIFDSGPDDLEIAQALGVKWRRGIPHTDSDTVSPAPGKFWGPEQIQKARDAVQAWKDHDVLCLGYVNYNMTWNVQPDPLGRKISPHENRPKDMAAHAEMVYNLIKPLSDQVKHWELWNEPWIHEWTWRTGTAQDYRDYTRIIWDRVKPEMPDVMLIGGGSTPFQRDILFAKNSTNAGYVDGVNTHPYGIPEPTSAAYAALDAYMARNWSKGQGKGGIWATELGTSEFVHYKDQNKEQGRLTVARSVAPLYVLNRLGAGDVPIKSFWFASGYKRGFSGDFLNIWDWEKPKPAVAAYSAMTHFLEDAALTTDLYPQSKALWAVHFSRTDGTQIVVCWPEQGYKGQMSLPAEDFTAFDYLGRSIGKVENGRLVLPMQSWECRYILSKRSPDQVRAAFASAQFPGFDALLVNPRSFTAPLDRKPALRVKVENILPVPVTATLELTSVPAELQLATTSQNLATLQPGESRIVVFPLASAKPNAINRYPVTFRAKANNMEQTGTQVIQVACATLGTPKIDGDLADWKDAVPVTLVARGSKDVTRILLNPGETERLLHAPNAEEGAVYRLWTRWDDRHLYVAAEIPDNKLSTNSTFQDDPYAFPFFADCLQFAFACNAENPGDLLRGHPLHEKAYAADTDYEFVATLARLTNDGESFAAKPGWKGDYAKAPRVPQLHRLRAPGTNFQTFYPTNAPTNPPLGAMNATPDGGPEGQIQIVYDDAKKVYRYEMAIPWSSLPALQKQVQPLTPGQNAATRFAFSVNDPQGRWRSFWQNEAGDVQSGAYGFTPSWEGGRRAYGGRILTDWGFAR